MLSEYRVTAVVSGSLHWHTDICLVIMVAGEWPMLSGHLQCTSPTEWLHILNVIIVIGAVIYSLCVHVSAWSIVDVCG